MTQYTEINLSESSLRDDYGKFTVVHGRPRPIPVSPARQRAQAAWVRARLLEQDIDVREFPTYQCVPRTRGVDLGDTVVYFGGTCL